MACFAQGNELIKLKPPTVKVSKLTGAGDVLMATHILRTVLSYSNIDVWLDLEVLFDLTGTIIFISAFIKG